MAKRSHKHEDPTFWFQGTVQGGYQNSHFVGPLCVCVFLGPKVSACKGAYLGDSYMSH